MTTLLEPADAGASLSVPSARLGRRLRSSTWSSPSHDEERALDGSVRTLHAFLSRAFPVSYRITVADNASTDGTWDIARGWPTSCRASGRST